MNTITALVALLLHAIPLSLASFSASGLSPGADQLLEAYKRSPEGPMLWVIDNRALLGPDWSIDHHRKSARRALLNLTQRPETEVHVISQGLIEPLEQLYDYTEEIPGLTLVAQNGVTATHSVLAIVKEKLVPLLGENNLRERGETLLEVSLKHLPAERKQKMQERIVAIGQRYGLTSSPKPGTPDLHTVTLPGAKEYLENLTSSGRFKSVFALTHRPDDPLTSLLEAHVAYIKHAGLGYNLPPRDRLYPINDPVELRKVLDRYLRNLPSAHS